MTRQRKLGYAAIIGVAFTIVITAAACIPHCDFFSFALLPGALMAALIFPQGIESDSGVAYLFLAALIDMAIYGCLAYVIIVFRVTKTESTF